MNKWNPDEINFDASNEDVDLIRKIVRRSVRLHLSRDLIDIEMDITATHCNGTPLDLPRLLAADDFNFGHDIAGIVNNLDRSTGKLMNGFLPRFSKGAAV